MILKLDDWCFRVDLEATQAHTTKNASDHCLCGYCKNYYDAVSAVYPALQDCLTRFGVNMNGPSELMPFEPTLLLACYRVQGEILTWGSAQLKVDGIQITPESGDDGSFLLWVGELALPWLQEEAAEDVVSPANLPEFLERMQQMWLMRHGNEFVFS